ncbi:MAG TPA: hypothetical protein VFA26_17090, partial [Gemmataceae bacterium]|nr:hypothetical protein [Gemmataceae bacterium]
MSGACLLLAAWLLAAGPLPGTKPLPDDGAPAARMVDGIHKYLDRETAAAPGSRKALWKWGHAELAAPPKADPPARARLRRILGGVDERAGGELEHVRQVGRPSLVAEGAG